MRHAHRRIRQIRVSILVGVLFLSSGCDMTRNAVVDGFFAGITTFVSQFITGNLDRTVGDPIAP